MRRIILFILRKKESEDDLLRTEARKPAKVQIPGQVWMTKSGKISSSGNVALARKQK